MAGELPAAGGGAVPARYPRVWPPAGRGENLPAHSGRHRTRRMLSADRQCRLRLPWAVGWLSVPTGSKLGPVAAALPAEGRRGLGVPDGGLGTAAVRGPSGGLGGAAPGEHLVCLIKEGVEGCSAAVMMHGIVAIK